MWNDGGVLGVHSTPDTGLQAVGVMVVMLGICWNQL